MCSEFFLQSQARRYGGDDPLAALMHEAVGACAPRRVRPTDRAPVVVGQMSAPEVVEAAWGLVPTWSKDRRIARHTFNARAETVHEKPAFRAAFRRRRCLVPVSGWVEWTGPRGRRERRFLQPGDGRVLCLAGLWETWNGGEAPLRSFTIVTTDAAPEIAQVHDRMPRVLQDRDEWAIWLEGVPEAARALLDQAADAPRGLRVMESLVEPAGA